jgi:hypothetical protein
MQANENENTAVNKLFEFHIRLGGKISTPAPAVKAAV